MSTTLSDRELANYIEHKELQVTILDQWGWLDRAFIFPEAQHTELFDLKTGRYSVDPAETNLQIWGYNVGIWDTFEFVETIGDHLIIPRRNEVHHHVFSRAKHYEEQKTEVFKIIERAKLESGKTFKSGWYQCRFCGNKANCPALREFVNQIAPRYNEELVIPEPIHPSQITDLQILDRTFLLGKVIEKWYESLRFHITALAREGFEFEHFKLIELKGERRIIRPVRIWELLQERGWDMDTFLNCCEVSVTKIDEEISRRAPHGRKAREKQQFNQILQDENAVELGPPTYQMRAKSI